MTTGPYTFVVRGDRTKVDCDGLVVPTDVASI